MQKSTKYFGITIGPVFQTLLHARKTRELWAGSYLFSYLMKKLMIRLKQEEAVIIFPYAGALQFRGQPIDLFEDRYEAGIFPDRCIFQLEPTQDLKNIHAMLDEVKIRMVNEMVHQLEKTQAIETSQKAEAASFFKDYLQIYLVTKSFNNATKRCDINKQLFDALDRIELVRQIVPPEKDHYLVKFLTTATFKAQNNPSFLIQDARTSLNNERVRFESIIELAVAELISTAPTSFHSTFERALSMQDDTEEDLVTLLKEHFSETFQTHHKYIAVVNMDGDNFGQLISQLSDEQYVVFSKKLALFNLHVHELIDKFGGLPVYLGGDDALFFSPLRSQQGTIFQLISAIDSAFKELFNDFLSQESAANSPLIEFRPSLSFGVGITFYKHPLGEALEYSSNLLFQKAKSFQNEQGLTKNAVAVTVRKHSGHTFGICLNKKSLQNGSIPSEKNAYSFFLDLIEHHIEDGQFLNSMVQVVVEQDSILQEIALSPHRLQFFFENNFNEPIHDQETVQQYLKNLCNFIPALFSSIVDPKQRKEALYGSLRLVKFFNREDHV